MRIKRHSAIKNYAPDHENEAQIRALSQAVADLRIEDASETYYALKDKSKLTSHNFRTIAQSLHHCWRVERRKAELEKRRLDSEKLVTFAEELVKDVKKGKLAPHRKAHIHLLGFFKECGVRDAGVRFWSWLQKQDELFVDQAVYGAAIELLAVNGTPLSELEDIYQQALTRFPGSFAAYHLSPEAILPDRTRATNLGGVSMSLLQGILTARLLHGHTRNAYLALDTVLRLYPDQAPTRFFTLFLEERPLLEAYTVFAMACRSGVTLQQNQFRHFLTALRTSSDLISPTRHAIALRAMLSAMYMYIGVGGTITPNLTNELVIGLTQFLRLKGVASLEARKKQQIVNELMEIIRATFVILARYGAKPGLSAFNAIITNLGGYGHSKQTIGIALSDAHALDVEPNLVTRRSVLTAAGLLNDKDFVSKSWKQIVEARANAEGAPDATDWHCFVKAAHASGQIGFAREEFEDLREKVPDHEHYGILNGLDDSGIYHLSTDSAEDVDTLSLLTEIKKIRADIELIGERTKDRPKVQDFREQRLHMTLLPIPGKAPLPEKELVNIYDELTTEQGASPPVEASEEITMPAEQGSSISLTGSARDTVSQPAITATNIPFGTLRYENWKSINWLLEQAEANDETHHKVVDKAIAAGVVPPKRTLGLDLSNIDKVESYGLSNTIRTEKKPTREKSATGEEIQKAREYILRLRGRLA